MQNKDAKCAVLRGFVPLCRRQGFNPIPQSPFLFWSWSFMDQKHIWATVVEVEFSAIVFLQNPEQTEKKETMASLWCIQAWIERTSVDMEGRTWSGIKRLLFHSKLHEQWGPTMATEIRQHWNTVTGQYLFHKNHCFRVWGRSGKKKTKILPTNSYILMEVSLTAALIN